MSDPAAGGATGSAGVRRDARERALELAYEAEQRGLGVDDLLATLIVEPDPLAVRLLRSAERRREEAERLVVPRLRGWRYDRLPLLDRLVLRLAISELLDTATPTGVVLAEAVDLAARYGTDDSSRFVNGLLANVARDLERSPD